LTMWWKDWNNDEPSFEEDDDDDFNASHRRYEQTTDIKPEPSSSAIKSDENFDEKEDGNNNEVDEFNWEVSHKDTCVSLCSLQATPNEVLELCGSSVLRPNKSRVVLSNEEDLTSLIITEEQRKRNNNKKIVQEEEQKKSPWLLNFASTCYNMVAANEENELLNNSNWEQEEDDNCNNQNEGSLVKWKDTVMNINLAGHCCHSIINSVGSDYKTFWLKKKDDDLSSSEHSSSSLRGWLSSNVIDDAPFDISKLEDSQLNMLVEALIEMGHAQIFENDVIVLGGTSEEGDEKIREAQNSIFRLDQTMHNVEERIKNWSEQRDEAVQKAIRYKREKKKHFALQQLKRKALYERQMETAHQTLLNLQQLQQAIELSQSNVEMVNLLKESKSALQSSQSLDGEAITLEQVDDLALDLQDEYQLLEDVQGSLLNSMGASNSSSKDEDEELLNELAVLEEEMQESLNLAKSNAEDEALLNELLETMKISDADKDKRITASQQVATQDSTSSKQQTMQISNSDNDGNDESIAPLKDTTNQVVTQEKSLVCNSGDGKLYGKVTTKIKKGPMQDIGNNILI